MFNILGKFFFFYMVAGVIWDFYNKYMYGQSNLGEHSTKVCSLLALVIVVFIEVYGIVSKRVDRKKEDK